MVEISDIHCFSLSAKNESAPCGNSLRTSLISAISVFASGFDCCSFSWTSVSIISFSTGFSNTWGEFTGDSIFSSPEHAWSKKK